MITDAQIAQLIATIVYSGLGLIVFGIGFWLVCKIVPFSVKQEIVEDENTALGVILGAVILGQAIIIAAAIT